MQGRNPEASTQSSSGQRLAVVLACLLLLAGCGPAARRSTPLPTVMAAQELPDTAYRLDDARSELRLLVYRDGPLARLGHNHVLLGQQLDGALVLGQPGRPARFEVRLPVAALRVDEPTARAAAGPDFDSVPSAADIDGTRRHLLGPTQLDAERYPLLRVDGTLETAAGASVAHAHLELRGQSTALDLPVTITLDADHSVTVSGAFKLRQTTLGLVPYSVALGALQVRDEVEISFRLVGQAPVAAVAPPSKKQ
ncbi:MAG: YceI family protein [Proteobacteria bacterium]|nr:YceI family protein [Pseudomonadota bacterium]